MYVKKQKQTKQKIEIHFWMKTASFERITNQGRLESWLLSPIIEYISTPQPETSMNLM